MKSTIKTIFQANNINEDFVELTTTGLANRVFATTDYILRIPTDHEEALSDARTESVAAPIAYENGILTPKLIRYDNSCKLLDRSYSIWRRIHGFSLDKIENKYELKEIWSHLGYEIARLHTKIDKCDDPNGWLDSPDRDYTKEQFISLINNQYSKNDRILAIVDKLYSEETFQYNKAFVHGDTHEGNVMCTNNFTYAGLIDWGDSGWADPAIDFYMIPYQVIDTVLESYKTIASFNVNDNFINRIILDKIWTFLENNEELEVIFKFIDNMEMRLKKNLTTSSTSYDETSVNM